MAVRAVEQKIYFSAAAFSGMMRGFLFVVGRSFRGVDAASPK